MKRIIQSLAPLCAMACSQGASPEPANSVEFGTAQQAIETIQSRDGELASGCEAAVQRCEDEAKGGELCAHIAQGCANLDTHLAKLRGPTIECWESVKTCARGGGDCADTMDACEAMGGQAGHERGGAVGCFDAVHECVNDFAAGGPFAGDHVSEACSFGGHGFGPPDGGALPEGFEPPDGFLPPDGGAPLGLPVPPEGFEPPEGLEPADGVPGLDEGELPSEPPGSAGDFGGFGSPDAGAGFPGSAPQR